MPPGFQLTGKTMPFWTLGKVSDAEVEDLVAYILAAREAARTGAPAPACGSDPSTQGTPVRGGAFANGTHGVAGTVEELDTRRLRLSGFSFDGGGIEVRVWLSKRGSDASGLAVGPDLFGRQLDQATLAVELPPSVSSSDFDRVSIRCVIGGQDLGTADLSPAP